MNANDMLTKNFRLSEFERSLTASLKGYDHTVPPMAVYALRHLCELFLQPLRDMLAAPVIITSGYRCRDLNREVGGSDTSWHLTGCAADFHPSDDALRPAVVQFVKDWKERGDAWRRNHDEHDEPGRTVHRVHRLSHLLPRGRCARRDGKQVHPEVLQRLWTRV